VKQLLHGVDSDRITNKYQLKRLKNLKMPSLLPRNPYPSGKPEQIEV
jgi:hypothetical protein